MRPPPTHIHRAAPSQYLAAPHTGQQFTCAKAIKANAAADADAEEGGKEDWAGRQLTKHQQLVLHSQEDEHEHRHLIKKHL